MKMKGDEKEERGNWPRKAYEAFTACSSPGTPMYQHSVLHTYIAVTDTQVGTHTFAPLFILWGEQQTN